MVSATFDSSTGSGGLRNDGVNSVGLPPVAPPAAAPPPADEAASSLVAGAHPASPAAPATAAVAPRPRNARRDRPLPFVLFVM